MKTIYKYPIEIVDLQTIIINNCPTSHPKIIKVGLDTDGNPCIWAIVDSDSPKNYPVRLRIFYTGRDISSVDGNTLYNRFNYLDSFIDSSDDIAHVFVESPVMD